MIALSLNSTVSAPSDVAQQSGLQAGMDADRHSLAPASPELLGAMPEPKA